LTRNDDDLLFLPLPQGCNQLRKQIFDIHIPPTFYSLPLFTLLASRELLCRSPAGVGSYTDWNRIRNCTSTVAVVGDNRINKQQSFDILSFL
jgi:hypothetical protein